LTLFTVLYFICIAVQLRSDNCFIKEAFDLTLTLFPCYYHGFYPNSRSITATNVPIWEYFLV